MKRSDKYERQRTIKTILGSFVITGLLLVAAAVFLLKRQVDSRSAQVDKDSFCPKDGITAVTALIVDSTDALSAVQKASLRVELEKAVNAVARYGRLDIYAVESSQRGLPKPLFSMCSPGRREEASPWTSNPERVERRWRDRFYSPALSRIDACFEQARRESSPIMETIQSVSISSFRNGLVSDNAHRQLVLASDMIEFSPDLNMYRGVPSIHDFFNGESFRKLRGDLRGVDVSILLFRRATAAQIQRQNFIDFWAALLVQQGAIDVRSKPIVG